MVQNISKLLKLLHEMNIIILTSWLYYGYNLNIKQKERKQYEEKGHSINISVDACCATV